MDSGESASVKRDWRFLADRHKAHFRLKRDQIADLYFPDHLHVNIAEVRTQKRVELSKSRRSSNQLGVEPVRHSLRGKEFVNCVRVELIPNPPKPFSYDGFVGCR